MRSAASTSPDSDSRFSAADIGFMRRALELAERGLYTTTPNPRVGCVLVRDGAVMGEGWHVRAGDAHAEVNAIADARARGRRDIQGATAYVTLEPCNHAGRTGPCTQALIGAGVRRVIFAMEDPNPHAGHGAARLRAAGVDVASGLLESEARALNVGFVSRMTRGRPWIRMKVAASLDGRTALASGASQWITGGEARHDGHRYRARACAILTGIGTVRADDPQLTVRGVDTSRQPRRIILDRSARTPPTARVLAGGALVVTAGRVNAEWPRGTDAIALPDAAGGIDLSALMLRLGSEGINELHVEAGARLNGALLAAGLVDELLLYVAPCLIGDPARGIALLDSPLQALSERVRLAVDSIEAVGADWRVIARIVHEAR